MSHFTVMVKVTNQMVEELGLEEAVAQQLAPYQENNMSDCPREFLEFNDVEEEYREKYETEETECVLTPDGELKWPWDYDKPVKMDDPLGKERQIPEGHQLVTRPFKDRYSSFEQFMEEHIGYKEKDSKTGKYGYWENPNAKWDWYQIGGRWQGSLRLKEKAIVAGTAKKGKPSLLSFLNKESASEAVRNLEDPHTADIAQFKDIDFEGMDAEADTAIRKFYEDAQEIRKLEAEGKDIGGDLSFGARWEAIDIGLVNRDEEGKYTTMKTTFTLEDLLTDYRYCFEWATYTVVDEAGKWHEKATVGWFGCHDGDEDNTKAWQKFFKRDHLTNVDPDTWIVIVDCHT